MIFCIPTNVHSNFLKLSSASVRLTPFSLIHSFSFQDKSLLSQTSLLLSRSLHSSFQTHLASLKYYIYLLYDVTLSLTYILVSLIFDALKQEVTN